MAIVEELLELEDKPTGIVDSGPSPYHFALRMEPVSKLPAWVTDPPRWLKVIATVWLPISAFILTGCYFIVSHVVNHALGDLDGRIDSKADTRIAPIATQVTGIDQRLSKMEGWKEGVEGDVRVLKQKQIIQQEDQNRLQEKVSQQAALNRLQDPRRILATIRAEIQLAESQRRVLPASTLADYREAVQALPSSAFEYWTTVATVINYQSLVLQMSGEAPDPAKVARPCMTTSGGGIISRNNSYTNLTLSNCIVDLDTNYFESVTFVNSVVRYHGGGDFPSGRGVHQLQLRSGLENTANYFCPKNSAARHPQITRPENGSNSKLAS